MKRYTLLIILTSLLLLTGCCQFNKNTSYTKQEQPHLYWKDIDVVVTDIDKRHWYALTHWYVVEITVESKEYDLTESFELKGSGVFGCPNQWDYEEGQVIKAELYSWVMDSTGEVIKRKIHKVY